MYYLHGTSVLALGPLGYAVPAWPRELASADVASVSFSLFFLSPDDSAHSLGVGGVAPDVTVRGPHPMAPGSQSNELCEATGRGGSAAGATR